MKSPLFRNIEHAGICTSGKLQRVIGRDVLGFALEGVLSLASLGGRVLVIRLGYVDDWLRGRGERVGKCCLLILPSVDEGFAYVSLVVLYPYK